MKRLAAFLVSIFVLNSYLHAQDVFSYLASYQQVALYGFADSAGNTKTGGKYNLIMQPVDGICKVWAGQRSADDYIGIKTGYCLTDGRELIAPQFERAEDFYEGLALVATGDFMKGYTYGYINKQGAFQIPQRYKSGKSFSQGLAAVSVDEKEWKYIDKNGAVKIAGPFLDADAFSEGLACISVPYDMGSGVKSFKRGYIDQTGKIVVEPEYVYGTPFKDGYAIVTVSGTKESDYKSYQAVIDRKGNRITTHRFISIQPAYEGLWPVKIKGTYGLNKEKDEWGLVDNKGTLYAPRFEMQPIVREGMIAFQKDSLWGYMDKTGKVLIKPAYKRANGFMEGLAAVQTDEKLWGFIN
ncbi:MAG: WG repeat-containing protein, partial [Chitinophagaceae bacterium]|nr:WG repeat-containing protein [Chitinophagaceae bacterium]